MWYSLLLRDPFERRLPGVVLLSGSSQASGKDSYVPADTGSNIWEFPKKGDPNIVP